MRPRNTKISDKRPLNVSKSKGIVETRKRSDKPSRTASRPPSPPPTKAVATEILPSLPDDVWSKILFHAGTSCTISASTVNVQLYRVAKTNLLCTHTLHLSRHFVRTSQHTIHEFDIIHVLKRLPNLSTLTILQWPWSDILSDIGAIISNEISLYCPKLHTVEFMGIALQPSIITRLLETCVNLSNLSIGSHDTISNAVIRAIVTAKRQKRLKQISISDAGRVGDDGIDALMSYRTAEHMILKKLPRLQLLRIRAFGMKNITVMMCTRLTAVKVRCGMEQGDEKKIQFFSSSSSEEEEDEDDEKCIENDTKNLLMYHYQGLELNVSQNRNLRTMTLELTPTPSSANNNNNNNNNNRHNYYPPESCTLQSLNTSGCNSLRDIYIHRAREHYNTNNNDDEDDADFTIPFSMPFLHTLNVFGCRVLSQRTFSQTFGLSSDSGVHMNQLRHLYVNGTSGMDALHLDGYSNLESIDASGSSLRSIHVNNCWKLSSLAVSGRRMPLNYVMLVMPAQCSFSGRRKEWHFERCVTHKSFSYP